MTKNKEYVQYEQKTDGTEYLKFSSDVVFAKKKSDEAIKFKMVGYTGQPMYAGYSEIPIVIDCKGIDFPANGKIPILLDHVNGHGVGHSTAIDNSKGKLTLEGVISRDNEFAKDVIASGKGGYPWQASVGGYILRSHHLEEGANEVVNGRTVEGPVRVVEQFKLKETSFVDLGADGDTEAQIFAKEKSMKEDVKNVAPENEELKAAAGVKEPEKKEVPAVETVQAKSAETVPKPDVGEEVKAAYQKATQEAMLQMRSQMMAERERIGAIEKIGSGKYPELEKEAINAGWTSDQFELAYLRKKSADVPNVNTGTYTPESRQVLEAAAILSAFPGMTDKLAKKYDDKTIQAAENMRGERLCQFMERASGRRMNGAGDFHNWVSAAWSTTDMSGILSNIAHKTLLEGFTYVDQAWRQIADVTSVNDFKKHTRYRMNSNFEFQKVPVGGQIPHGEISEESFEMQVETSGIMFSMTRQMIVNDDLSAFTRIPREIGMGAADAINKSVWTTFLANANTADGNAFFSANHNNFLSGATTTLSLESLQKAETKFLKQTKPNGTPLGIDPTTLLVPPELKVTAQLLTTAATWTGGSSNIPEISPYAGKFKVVTTPYLSNSAMTGYSETAWYLLADPVRLPVLEVAFLNGKDAPTVESARPDPSFQGINFYGYCDFGVAMQDYRGGLKVKGAA